MDGHGDTIILSKKLRARYYCTPKWSRTTMLDTVWLAGSSYSPVGIVIGSGVEVGSGIKVLASSG